MSGHSKWHNIKRKKEITDAKRGKIFSKISRLITVATREKGSDIETNPSLRLAVEKAKEAKMPKENIDRAILKGSGGGKGEVYEEVIYEGYGPEGVAFLVKGFTDNRNRTVAEIRLLFDRAGGSLGATGSTAYIFGADPENPMFEIEVDDAKKAKDLFDLVEKLEEQDDIQEVFANFTVSDGLEGQLQK
ncbi:YebC/PmpR family DNA-binding transcriptional regulator [candidate division WWE3 bacterium]|nr:YebC/PmpR family DNA-binding transcriptional regulator [candidate division WWE3 bacterium]